VKVGSAPRRVFAAHAAIALTGSTQQAEFRRALSSRDTIGIAKES